jgi:2-dehydropantoate 2-reductase
VTVRAAAADQLEAVRDADVVIVALITHSLPLIAPSLGALLSPGAATKWAQNGIPWWYFRRGGGPLRGLALESVDPGGAIAASIPIDSVIGAVIYIAAELEGPGVVRFVEGRRLTLGRPDGTRGELSTAISDAFQAGGLSAGRRGPARRDLAETPRQRDVQSDLGTHRRHTRRARRTR